MSNIALVTGANRGIGFETCQQLAQRGFRVVLTSRDPHLDEEAADVLRMYLQRWMQENVSIRYLKID